MAGTCLAGQLPGPAEPDAGTPRQCDIRVEGRSVSGPRPDSLLRCSALGGLLTQPLNVPADGEAGWCWPAAWPAAVRSRSAADLYALGQWSAAWSRLARSPRVVGPLGLSLVVPHSELVHVFSMAVCSSEHSWQPLFVLPALKARVPCACSQEGAF